MSKKHFNPITGEVSVCSADEGNCPFIKEMVNLGGDPAILHGGNVEANAEAWMKAQHGNNKSVSKKRPADAIKRTEIPARYLRAGMNIGNGVIASAYSGPRTPKGKIDVVYITEDGTRKTGQWNRATLIQVFEPIREE